MGKVTKTLICAAVMILLCAAANGVSAAAGRDAALARWTKTESVKDDFGGTFTLKATLYTAEYIEALMRNEAEKNMWTASELEDYKYNFLKELNLDDNIAVHIEVEELGPTAHMAPFDEMLAMWIGKTKHSPSDYDKRFNIPLQGKRDGMVFFPRYDEKTGKPLLNRKMSLRLVVNGAVSPVINNRELRFTWDVEAEDATSTISGTAADRLEIDRLLRRMEKLTAEKTDLESRLTAKNEEIKEVNERIEELRNR
ncbi:MAG: hypothetical protein LBE65_02820 [Synergistaceae bacterium]|jgi:hypothetical protein|nr:hypothetical protein [Synergistaceae bacterium]